MTLRGIRLLPDPVLREACLPVVAFDARLRDLAADMLETMYAAPGRGLAAPQVGVAARLFVMDVDWKTGTPAPHVFVNPVIVARSDDTVTGEEACLSIPGQVSRVTRARAVTLAWQDLDGAAHERLFDGFAAICVQHEADHLDGVLCIDRVDATTP